jgi:hypothetical protein
MITDSEQSSPQDGAIERKRNDAPVLDFRCSDWWCLIVIALVIVFLGR